MLMALELPLPRKVFAHGFLQVGGEKMSKSKLTGISPHDLVATFGSDGYRYYFMRDISFGQDGSFSWEGMAARYNSDLANDFGNLASRVLSMIGRYLDGAIPSPPGADELTDAERSLIAVQEKAFEGMRQAIAVIAPHEALKAGWELVRRANAYVEAVAPWQLAKDETNRRRLEVVLYHGADVLRLLALMTFPITPRASQDLWSRLGLEGAVAERAFDADLRWGLLPAGAKVTVGAPLFPRVDDAVRSA
jgi:methionyl-tRNA synthetase